MENIAPNASNPNTGLKIAVIVLSVVVAIMAGALLYIAVHTVPQQKQQIIELRTEKDTLMDNLFLLRAQYAELQTSNDTLNAQLDVEREKVELMIEKLRKTDANNKAKIREYERELGTLRDIMRGYIYTIDSLNTLALALREETTTAKAEARESQERYKTLIETTDNLAKQVEKGSIVKARGIVVTALNAKDKDGQTRARNTAKLKACFTLVENSIAAKGPRSVFIRVKGPDSVLMTQSAANVFQVDGESLIYSAVREVDYQGADIDVCVFYGGNGETFTAGVYIIDIYSGGALIGSGQLLLK